MGTDDPLTYHASELTPDERHQLLNQQKADMERIAHKYWYEQHGRDEFLQANDIRVGLLGRMAPWQKNFPNDVTYETAFKALLDASVAPDYYAKGILGSPEYLENLSKRLAQQ